MYEFVSQCNNLFPNFKIIRSIKPTFRCKIPHNQYFMPENQTTATESTQLQEPKIAKIGKLQRVEIAIPKDNPTNNNTTQNTDSKNNEGANATSEANNGGAADDNKTKATPPAPTEFTDEQLKEFFKSKGIDYDGIDNLKQKLTAPQTTTELTDEQKKAKALAREKRIIDRFTSDGRTIEEYMAIKGISQTDERKFAIDLAKENLKKEGFTQEEAEEFIKERYFQIDDAELEQEDDETDKAFKKRTKEYFAKQLANLSSPIRTKAAGILADLNAAIEAEDLQAQNELTLSSNIDEQFKKIARKDTYEIGEINGKPITPIESEVPESELAAAWTVLKDPAKRQQFLYNQDGSPNITEIGKVLTENAKLKAAMKVSYHEGSTRTNAHWEKVFGARSPQELGVGGNTQKPTGQKPGQPVSYGKVRKVEPQRQ